jgi:Carbohydrate esterase 2 N-terminal/GDSL-like Lipase/Acylhydrolase family
MNKDLQIFFFRSSHMAISCLGGLLIIFNLLFPIRSGRAAAGTGIAGAGIAGTRIAGTRITRSQVTVAQVARARNPKTSAPDGPEQFFPADDPAIQYMGRIDFSNPKSPRFWAPGVSIRAKFKGPSCRIIVRDEVLYGNSHNYIEIVTDKGQPYRIQTLHMQDTIVVRGDPARGEHAITVCKDTESGIGYLEFVGFICEKLLPLPPPPSRKIEYIGNSVTCGSGIDIGEIACGKGKWYDQHNAWMSYGPLTARALNAQWHLSAVSGIGLIHSCCEMGITMPQVFDKMNQRADTIAWDFTRYQPDVLTICLGQNDSTLDSTAFCNAYIGFIARVRNAYPNAQIVCLSSPMADSSLTVVLKNYLTGIVAYAQQQGDAKVHTYFYSKRYYHSCGGHPDMDEHLQIAAELTTYLRKLMNW